MAAVTEVSARSNPRLKARRVRREGRDRGEVAAGGAAGDDQRRGIGAVRLAVFADPGDDALDIDQVVGEPRGGTEAVVGADADPSPPREPMEQRAGLVALPSASKRTTVQMYERWTGRRMRTMAIDVEPVPPARVAIVDVRDPFDVARAERKRREDHAREPRGAQPTGRSAGIHRGATARSEMRAHGVVDRRACLQASPRHDGEPERGEDDDD
jgi:hypothetical protein